MLLTMVMVVSLGLNFVLIVTIFSNKRKVQVAMSENSDALDGLATDVHSESSAVDSAVVLINGLTNRLTDILASSSGTEDLTAKIQALRDEISARSVALGQAVAAGTAAENDSSNFPTTPTGQVSGTTSDGSTGTTSSDTSATPGTTDSGSSQQTGSDAASSSGTSDSTSSDSLPNDATAGAGTPADVADPSVADLPPEEDSPPPIETTGDEAVVPAEGAAVPDEGTVSDSTDNPPSE